MMPNPVKRIRYIRSPRTVPSNLRGTTPQHPATCMPARLAHISKAELQTKQTWLHKHSMSCSVHKQINFYQFPSRLTCTLKVLDNIFTAISNLFSRPTTSLGAWWSELLTTNHEVPGSIPGSNMCVFPWNGKTPMVTMVWVVGRN